MARNTDEVLLWENPGMLGNPWGNPRKRRRARRRNPSRALAMPTGLTDLTQGVGVEEILGGGLGLVGAAATPRMIVAPDVEMESLTTNQKLMRVGVGVITTFAVGFVANTVAGKRAAKAAVIGGLAGTAITVINTFTTMKLGAGAGSVRTRDLKSFGSRTSGRVSTQTPGFEDIKLY